MQSIVEKMKRHILAITSIENTMDGEDADETQSLLQAQEQQHRATQRYVLLRLARNNKMFVHL